MSTSFPSQPQLVPPSIPPGPFPNPPRRGGNLILGLLLAFMGVLVLGGVICTVGIWYVVANVDRWLVGFGREAIVALIEDADISPGEKQAVIAQVDRVVTAYKERQINQADLEQALNELNAAPAFQVLSLYGLDTAYLEESGLNEHEIEAGRRTFQRALRGVYEGKFSADDLYAALPGASAAGEENEDQLTLVAGHAQEANADDDVREWLLQLKVQADNAGIPDEPFELDLGDEVKKIVDRLLTH